MQVQVLRAFFYGKRFEENDVVDLPEDVIKALGPKYVKALEVKKDVGDAGRTEDVPEDKYCKRAFEYGNYTEETEAIGGIVWLTETPVESVSEIKTSEGATLTIYRLDKGAGMIVLEQNYTGPVKVGYTGGLQNIPPDLKLAVMRLAEFYNVKAEGVAAENIGELKATYDNLPMVVARTLELYRRVKI